MADTDQPSPEPAAPTKGKRATKAKKGLTDERAAEILAEAEFVSDKVAATRNRVCDRTIRAWRERAEGDAAFAAIFLRKKNLLETEWLPRATALVNVGLDKMRELIEGADTTQLRVVAGAVNLVMEHVAAAGMLGGRSIPTGKPAAEQAADDRAHPGGNGARPGNGAGRSAGLH